MSTAQSAASSSALHRTANDPAIDVRELRRVYRIRSNPPGTPWWRSFVSPHFERREALRGLTFQIAPGEFVGYIGANGAGKSTTFKILAGILAPSEGRVTVLGLNPLRQRFVLAWHLGYLAGQKGHLWWDLPVRDTFVLLRRIYRIPEDAYQSQLAELVDLLALERELDTPVRQLSLGTRMRAELVATFLHRPSLVLLDEPTIGLDVLAKHRVREFLRSINRRSGTTILLASHDLGDVEALCSRILLIDRGELLFDGSPQQLAVRESRTRRLRIERTSADVPLELPPEFRQVTQDGAVCVYEFDPDKADLSRALRIATDAQRVRDLTIEPIQLGDVVRTLYEELERT